MLFAGELAALGVAVLWAVGTLAYERFGAGMQAAAINRFRTVVAALLIAAAWAVTSAGAWPDARTTWVLIVSGVLSFGISDTMFFAAMNRLGGQAAATSQTAVPVLVAALAWLGLGERLATGQLVGLGLTLTSVTVAMLRRRDADAGRDEAGVCAAGVTLAALAALLQAIGLVVARAGVSTTVDVSVATLLRVAPSAALLTLLAGTRRWASPRRRPEALWPTNPRQLVGLAGAVVVGTFLSTMLQTYALQHTRAGVCAVLGATYPLWMIPLGRILGARIERGTLLPTAGAVAGVGLVVALAG